MLSDYVTSHIRTLVPIGMGLLLTWIAAQTKIVVDPQTEASLAAVSVAVLSSGYYALARLLEHKWPRLGWLLGAPKKPTYPTS